MRGVVATGLDLGAARDLDPAAVAAAYQAWAPGLHRWLAVVLGDPGAARDLVGAVFADARGGQAQDGAWVDFKAAASDLCP